MVARLTVVRDDGSPSYEYSHASLKLKRIGTSTQHPAFNWVTDEELEEEPKLIDPIWEEFIWGCKQKSSGVRPRYEAGALIHEGKPDWGNGEAAVEYRRRRRHQDELFLELARRRMTTSGYEAPRHFIDHVEKIGRAHV